MKLVPICRLCLEQLSCSFTVSNKYEPLICVKCGKLLPISTFIRKDELFHTHGTKPKSLTQADLPLPP